MGMSSSEVLREQITALAGAANTRRVAGWTGAVAIVVGEHHWVTCVVGPSAVELSDRSITAPTTLRASSFAALHRWLIDGVDYTHLVASGEFTVLGVYFDVLLLSKVLGLRPDRKASVSR
ncbi:hypothetical protein [Mycolicibacterium goodii]|uniref:hypothetical protein n=1 Tax=Mycolicibacterium goodii TaxID=134601 RepID=UPI0012FF9CE3